MQKYDSITMCKEGIYNDMEILSPFIASGTHVKETVRMENRLSGLSVVKTDNNQIRDGEAYIYVILNSLGDKPFIYLLNIINFIGIVSKYGVRKGGFIDNDFYFELDPVSGNYKLSVMQADREFVRKKVELVERHIYKNVLNSDTLSMYLGVHNTMILNLRDTLSNSCAPMHIFYLTDLLDCDEESCGYGVAAIKNIENTDNLIDYGETRDAEFDVTQYLTKLNKSLENLIINRRSIDMESYKLKVFFGEDGKPLGNIDIDTILLMLRLKRNESDTMDAIKDFIETRSEN